MGVRDVWLALLLWGGFLSGEALEVVHASHFEVHPNGEACVVILDGEGYLGKEGWFLGEDEAEDLCIPISLKSGLANLAIRDKVYGKTYHLRVATSLDVPLKRRVILALAPLLPGAKERRGSDMAPEVLQESLGTGRYPVLGLRGASAPLPGFVGLVSEVGGKLRLSLRAPKDLRFGEVTFRVDGAPRSVPFVRYADEEGRLWTVADVSSVAGLLEVEVSVHTAEGDEERLGSVRIPLPVRR